MPDRKQSKPEWLTQKEAIKFVRDFYARDFKMRRQCLATPRKIRRTVTVWHVRLLLEKHFDQSFEIEIVPKKMGAKKV